MVNTDNSWNFFLSSEFNNNYMINIRKFLIEERKKKVIYPENRYIFNAFNFTPLDKVSVVILGQDPYSGKNQAHGLAFSVLPGISLPPSLKNIYIELYNDLGIEISDYGCLESWAKQGVLLLNSVLTVEKDKPLSHSFIGWEIFTDNVISLLNLKFSNIVFVLWGKHAKNKCRYIDTKKHYLLESSHPSPMSCNKGFFSSKPFSKVNFYLRKIGKNPINWKVYY